MYRENLKWCVLDHPMPDEYIFRMIDVGQSDEQFAQDLDSFGLDLIDNRLLERRKDVKTIVDRGEIVMLKGIENAVSLPVPVAIKNQDSIDASADAQVKSLD